MTFPRLYILAEDGKTPMPSGLDDWSRWACDRPPLFKTKVRRFEVSTVFEGMCDADETGAPLLFVTQLSGNVPKHLRGARRYATWDDAEAGHKATVEFLQREVDEELFGNPRSSHNP